METIIKELISQVLEPKRDTLIKECKTVVQGLQPLFEPYYANPKYFEIWFYHTFDFNYIFLGNKNYVVGLTSPHDNLLTDQIIEGHLLNEQEAWKVKKQAEFTFFMDCWQELEKLIGKPLRCFLIEYGVIRGLDVNSGKLIEGDDIENILSLENIAWR